jgi:hypothetical protein
VRTVKIHLAVGLIFLLFSGDGRAQQSTETRVLPPGPLISTNLGDFAAWEVVETIIKIDDPTKPAVTASEPGQVLYRNIFTRTKSITHIQTFFQGVPVGDRWCIGKTQVLTSQKTSPALAGGSMAMDPKSCFTEFSWISAQNFVGIQKKGERQGLVFKEERDVSTGGDRVMAPCVAMTDLESRRPISCQINTTLSTFTFLPAPTEMLAIPPDVQKLLRVAAANNGIVSHIPTPP